MNMFREAIENPNNVLPKDGIVKYYGELLSIDKADDYFKRLFTNIEWENDTAIIYGKKITTKRKVAWYGEQAFEYRYSGSIKKALAWTKALLELKTLAEEASGSTFNSCLLNLYHDGSEGMSWHSDAEKELKKDSVIASLSLGAERTFSFRHIETKEKYSLLLEHGSLLTMEGASQRYWQHCLPPRKKIKAARINLTFRTMIINE